MPSVSLISTFITSLVILQHLSVQHHTNPDNGMEIPQHCEHRRQFKIMRSGDCMARFNIAAKYTTTVLLTEGQIISDIDNCMDSHTHWSRIYRAVRMLL